MTIERTLGQGKAQDAMLSPYERLRVAIISGELLPGQPLIESALAERYEVSRTPIREALLRLEQDGLVVRQDRGLLVRPRSASEVIDLYETRIALEATAARIASERRTPHDLLIMRRNLRALENIGDDFQARAQANDGLHKSIWRASHNESLIDLLSRLGTHLARYPATTLSHPGRWEQSNVEHEQLIGAIERRDAVMATEVATQHFIAARDIRIQQVVESEEL